MMMNTTANATKTTLVYETKTCGRCGGTGHYSYNQIHGTVCYGCSGRKTTYTKAGKLALQAVQAFMAENFSVMAKDLTVGDVIKYDGYVRTVAAIDMHEGTGSSTTMVDGVTITKEYKYMGITFNKPVRTQFGNVSGWNMSQDTMIQKAVRGADWDRVVEFAKTIKKGVTIQTVAK